MKLSAQHLQRYKQIARLLWKYGRSDLARQMEIMDALDEAERREALHTDKDLPGELANDLEAMGPTYIKLGQVLASRPDILPRPYLKALGRLHNDVKPFPYEEVEAIVQSELGVRISKAFSFFEPEPMAAASLGQVHAAALRDGRAVVVKVQRPNIARQIAEDFEILAQIADIAEAHSRFGKRNRVNEIVEEFRLAIQQELDYGMEARNLAAVSRNLAEFDLIVVPEPVMDYCTRRVLTMEYVSGVKITAMSPIARLEVDGHALADQLFKAYLKQVLVDGLFHADPHPGNVFLTEDGRIALLDLGMVGRTTPGMQEALLKLLIAISDGKAEVASEIVLDMSQTCEGFDAVLFRRRIGRIVALQRGRELKDINVGRTLLDVTGTSAELGIYVPGELTLLGKTLLQLDEVGKTLDPEFDPNEAVRRHVADIMSRRMKDNASQGSVLSTVLELKDFVSGLPLRVNRIMDAVANRELEFKVRSPDAHTFLDGLQKIANRVTSGLILAALIVGAALLMRVETPFMIGGYPGFAIICFVAAAFGACWLLVDIWLKDERSERRLR